MKKVKLKKKTVKKRSMTRKAKVKTKPKDSGARLINFKASHKERSVIAARAKKFAKGNISGWLRYAGLNYVPPKSARI